MPICNVQVRKGVDRVHSINFNDIRTGLEEITFEIVQARGFVYRHLVNGGKYLDLAKIIAES